MQRVLILGGSGFLGANWVMSLKDSQEVHYTYNSNFVEFPNATGHAFDFFDCDLTSFLDRLKPDVVINTVALADVEKCEINKKLAMRLNAEVVRDLAYWTNSNGSKLVHISTDHLFDGTKKCFFESDEVSPLNNYALTKRQGETEAQENDPNSLIIRANFFGWGLTHRKSYSDYILHSLIGGRALNLANDAYFSPLYVDHLIELVGVLLKKNAKGIIHLGSDSISKYEFGVKLSQAFELNPSLINPTPSVDKELKAKKPVNMSLSSQRLLEFGIFDIPTLDQAIEALVNAIPRKDDLSEASSLIPYGRHFVDEADIQEVANTIRWDNLTQGKKVEELEAAICDLVGSKYALAVSSATCGLHLCYNALDLKAGDHLITSPITFVSTANAALYCSAKVSFVDIDPSSLNMSHEGLKHHLQSAEKPKIIVNVLFAGAAEGAESIYSLASERKIKLVEDAAHALGGKYSCGSPIGSCKYSDCTVFSLHPVKSIAAGEGGIITTNDPKIYARLKRLRSHGINKDEDQFFNETNAKENGLNAPWYYEMQELGFNYRLTDIQCSLAYSQLKKLPLFMERRKELARNYVKQLRGLRSIAPAQAIDIEASANHIFPVRVDFRGLGKTRTKIMHSLREKNIISQVHYIPVPMHPFYAKLGYDMKDYPFAKEYYDSALSIPLYYGLSDQKQAFVLNAISELL